MYENYALSSRKTIVIDELKNCNISELSEIRKQLLEKGNVDLIVVVDSLIREKADNIMSYSKVHGKSYVRVYKENRKKEKLKKCKKIRRR